MLDSTCLLGKGWWTDAWWRAAIDSGLMHIGNHSWDHNHETLPDSLSRGVRRGTFLAIDSKELADDEIRQAADYLRAHASNPGTALFAYPYGQSNRYLAKEYFPCYGGELGIEAAFTDRPAFLQPGCERWAIPRFVCGRDWSSPAQLRAILDEAAEAAGAWIPARPPEANVMSPPRDVAVPARAAKPRRKPSRIQVAFASPRVKKTSRGLVPMHFDIDGPRGTYELALTTKSTLSHRRSFTLDEDDLRVAAYLNSHLLRDGTTRIEASVTQAGEDAVEGIIHAQCLELGAAGGAGARESARLRDAAGAGRLRGQLGLRHRQPVARRLVRPPGRVVASGRDAGGGFDRLD